MAGGLVALELSLIRCFSVSHHHHFTALAISTALLGWGCSGTLLQMMGRRDSRSVGWLWGAIPACALSIPLVFRGVQALQVDLEFLIYRPQLIYQVWLAGILLMIPFVLGSFFLGQVIRLHTDQASFLYGSQLLGGGLGGAGITICMWHFSPVRLLTICALGVCMAGIPLCFCVGGPRKRWFGILAGSMLMIWWIAPFHLRVAEYKDLAKIRELVKQGDAKPIGYRYSPRGSFMSFSSDLFHTTLFASLTAPMGPPDQTWILWDGELISPVFLIENLDEASILRYTLEQVAYAMRAPNSVALLDETGGVAVWLAKLNACQRIVVVQQEKALRELASQSGAEKIYSDNEVTILSMNSRHFLETTKDSFDLIYVVSAQAPAAGISSLLALRETPLLTVEAFEAAINRLTPQGLFLVVRGLQTPARDNVKVLSTAVHALERLGIDHPGNHLVQVRNYLAAATLVSREPFGDRDRLILETLAEKLLLDIPWAPGIPPQAGMQYDLRWDEKGQLQDEYGIAARAILAGGEQRRKFYAAWPWFVAPARDDCPFFYRFFRLAGWPQIKKIYGRHWMQNAELGPLLLVLFLVQGLFTGILVLILPCWFLQRRRWKTHGQEKSWTRKSLMTWIHVGFLGLAYMTVEMGAIHAFTILWGDPVQAAAWVVSSFLLLSGLGGLSHRSATLHPGLSRMISLLVFVTFLFWMAMIHGTLPISSSSRTLLLALVLIPSSFLMGRPFPALLRSLGRSDQEGLPWAWGINGLMSVLAASGTVLVSVFAGISVAFLLGSIFYMAVSFTIPRVRS